MVLVGRALVAAALLAPSGGALAQSAPATYRFEAVQTTVERGVARPLSVTAFSTAGVRVAGMEVLEASVDRSPDGLPGARLPAFFTPSLDYGVYRFRADLPTDGAWALQFLARAPGEKQPVRGRVVFRVVGPSPAGRTAPQ